MTDEQRADLEYISTTSSTPDTPLDKSSLARQEHSTLYLVSTGTTLNEALERSEQVQPLIQQLSNCGAVSQTEGPQRFVSSKAEQERRLQLWQSFLQTHQPQLEQSLLAAAKRQGFTPESFSQFTKLLHTTFQPQEPSYFNLLATTVYTRNIIHHDNEYSVVTMLTGDTDTLSSKLSSLPTGSYTFDVEHMNASIANSLSNDFNYIGWVCGAIVFFFLWFSFRNIKLAIISFIPMAVSWLWILGIMTLLDIQFNVVNVILATFIFGQGDDYTIFITEGCLYEHVNKRPMLASYKNSIIISAVIMFIGIGVLILAKHPALYSLAQVTIVGMSSVVLMAWLLPPLLFKWLIHRKLI
jgi:predicted exporter